MAEREYIYGVTPSFAAYFLSKKLKEDASFVFWCVFPEASIATEFHRAITFFAPEAKTLFYPELELPPFAEALTPRAYNMEKISCLFRLNEAHFVIGSIKAFLRKTFSREVLKKLYLYLLPEEEFPREEFIENLVALGYERVGLVKEKGEFAVKGAVVDVWSPLYSFPVRIDFFGDEIISLKSFDPSSQRSIGRIEELIILPCREIVFASEFWQKESKNIYSRLLSAPELLSQVKEHTILENEELFLPYFYPDLTLIPEELAKEKKVKLFLFDAAAVEDKAKELWQKVIVSAERAKKRGRLHFDPEKVYASWEEIKDWFQRISGIVAEEVPVSEGKGRVFFVKQREVEKEKNESPIEAGFKALKKAIEAGEKVLLCTYSHKDKELILSGLRERGLSDFSSLEIKEGELEKGFFYPEENLWVVTEFELFRKRPAHAKGFRKKRLTSRFRNFEELKPGDFVVHRVHGIGKYLGLTFLEIAGTKGEFLEIEYQGGDKLYLPVTRLNELYPYAGVGEKPPSLDRLGKQAFLKRKKKVEKAISEIVQDLLTLYAERKAIKSFSIPFSSFEYEEFRATFPFEETTDQLQAIEEIIADLSSEKPMERLLVGDVGFGKTEVALRAIFLTAKAGKQVAFLVPTTILAEQHYRNFKERLEPFGIKVGVLSRLRSSAEQKQTIKALAEGSLQVVVGTHRLLSSDVRFKDLGLLVIDEEHKFGVRQKEKLKQLKKSVKVLTLSATPIPRSLQLSLLGIFDLSVIETPPPGRKSIKTILARFSPEIITQAIRQELERGGQVFFVNPRIRGLSSLAAYVKRLVPEASVEIIHGQMPPEVIEHNLYQFLTGKVNVLVCTPIIGSGIDIPSANTIIINRADMFGLADIYQLRGRVGRSEKEAYAYLLVPSLKALTEEAKKRLKALMQFVELGSGFKLALSDLKIRGAGQLLGVNQSGHINSVGYELYLELLQNTVKALKGEKIQDWEPEVNIKVPAYIPSDYIKEPEERLSVYKELVLIKTEGELEEFLDELADRYGAYPEEVKNLASIYHLKILMRQLDIPLIEQKGKNLVFLIKDSSLLPKFRKVSKKLRMPIRVKEEKGITKVIVSFTKESPLEISLQALKTLL